MRYLFIILLLLSLPGCLSTPSPLPKDYQGPTARIDDTFTNASHHSAHYFVVAEIDGKKMMHGAQQADGASFNQGRLVTRSFSRPLEAGKDYSITLMGLTQHSAPIIALVSDNYGVTGKVQFTPEANQYYIVTGELSESLSRVWIADKNGNRVTPIIEKKGDVTGIINDPIPKVTITKSKKEHFQSIKPGESVAMVIAKLGEPDETVTLEGSFWGNRKTAIQYLYKEFGFINFDTIKLKKQLMPVSVQKVGVTLQGEEDISSLKVTIDTQSPSALRKMAREFYKNPKVSNEVLDIFMQKIWDERHSQNPVMIDAVSWMCKVVGNSGNGRYSQAMQDVYDNTESSKLKKYAKKNRSKLGETATQFNLVKTESL